MGLSRIGEGRLIGIDEIGEFIQPKDQYYHEDYDQYVELERQGGKVTQINIWEDSTKTKYLSTASLSYSEGKVSQIVETLYELDGATISGTVTTNITRTGGHVSSVEVVRS
jgi:hypothetical protein